AVQAEEKEREANKERDEAQRQRDEVEALNKKLRATEAQLRRTLYTAHMNLAQQAWDAGGVDRTRELLELHRPRQGEADLRHFEWYYLYRLSHAELLTLKGHTGPVSSVTYSPDGERLVTFSTVRTQSPDGQRQAFGPVNTATVKLWDARTGKELSTLQHTGTSIRVAYSPDGK